MHEKTRIYRFDSRRFNELLVSVGTSGGKRTLSLHSLAERYYVVDQGVSSEAWRKRVLVLQAHPHFSCELEHETGDARTLRQIAEALNDALEDAGLPTRTSAHELVVEVGGAASELRRASSELELARQTIAQLQADNRAAAVEGPQLRPAGRRTGQLAVAGALLLATLALAMTWSQSKPVAGASSSDEPAPAAVQLLALGAFPANMARIERLLEQRGTTIANAGDQAPQEIEEPLYLAADMVAYGSFVPSQYDAYVAALESAKCELVPCALLVPSRADRSARRLQQVRSSGFMADIRRSQVFELWCSEDQSRGQLCASADQPLSEDETEAFAAFLIKQDELLFRRLCCTPRSVRDTGIECRTSRQRPPFFLWSTGHGAVVSIPDAVAPNVSWSFAIEAKQPLEEFRGYWSRLWEQAEPAAATCNSSL